MRMISVWWRTSLPGSMSTEIVPGEELTLNHAVAAYYQASGLHTAVRPIHRLDKDTTGPVLYAKNEYAQLKLDEDMREKKSPVSMRPSFKDRCRMD